MASPLVTLERFSRTVLVTIAIKVLMATMTYKTRSLREYEQSHLRINAHINLTPPPSTPFIKVQGHFLDLAFKPVKQGTREQQSPLGLIRTQFSAAVTCNVG
jgi:hypothetical protein